MENIIVEKMTIKHYNLIKDILENEFDDFWNPKILKEELENINSRYIIAKKNDEIVGFAGIKYNYENVEIMNIVTKRNQRRKGIARILLKKLIECSKEFNINKISLEVNENNLPAINLYKKMGFEVVGLRKMYYNGKSNAILMDYYL